MGGHRWRVEKGKNWANQLLKLRKGVPCSIVGNATRAGLGVNE